MAAVTANSSAIKQARSSRGEPEQPPAPTAPGNTGPLESQQADVQADKMTVSQVSRAWLWGAAAMLIVGAALAGFGGFDVKTGLAMAQFAGTMYMNVTWMPSRDL